MVGYSCANADTWSWRGRGKVADRDPDPGLQAVSPASCRPASPAQPTPAAGAGVRTGAVEAVGEAGVWVEVAAVEAGWVGTES